MNLCRYIIEIYNLVLSAGDDHGFQFSGKISAVETESLMSDVSFNILQFRILLQILRHKIGAKILEAELKLNDVCGNIFQLPFGEYDFMHDVGSKSEIIFSVRDTVAIFKKGIDRYTVVVKRSMVSVTAASSDFTECNISSSRI